MNKDNYSFFNIILFSIAVTLICVSSIIIKVSLSNKSIAVEEKKFEIYFSEPMFKNKTNSSIITNDNHIDISLNMNDEYSDSSFITSINNAGSFDGVLTNINKTNLKEYVVGIINDKEITLDDYIEFEVMDNNNTLKNNRIFKSNTNSDINVIIKKKIVNAEYAELLKKSEYNDINIELYIDVEFQQM